MKNNKKSNQSEIDCTKTLTYGGWVVTNKVLVKTIGCYSAVLLGELSSVRNIAFAVLCDKRPDLTLHSTEFFVQQHRIAESVGLSVCTVQRILTKLLNLKLISVRRKGCPAKNYYKINDKRVFELCEAVNNTNKNNTANQSYQNDSTSNINLIEQDISNSGNQSYQNDSTSNINLIDQNTSNGDSQSYQNDSTDNINLIDQNTSNSDSIIRKNINKNETNKKNFKKNDPEGPPYPPQAGKSIYTFSGGGSWFWGDIFCLEDVSGQDYFWVGNFDAKWENGEGRIYKNLVSSCI
jgi:DNA-binding transcriptional ArsR family regulator